MSTTALNVPVANDYPVQIVKNKDNGAWITKYKNKPEFGYIQLTSSEMSVQGGWIHEKKKSTLVRAKVEELQKFLTLLAKDGKLPGKILVREFLEDENLPKTYRDRIDATKDYEDAVKQFVKSTGKDGVPLTVGGVRILRFTDYVMQPKADDVDIIIQHDNIDEVSDWRAANAPKKEKKAPKKQKEEAADLEKKD